MGNNSYDVIIIGAGSIGVPTALYLSKEKLRVLVLDVCPSIGQGSNKAAIGGVRATHSNQAKALLALDSIQILSSWETINGTNIEWIQGGYSFVAYDQPTKASLKNIVEDQQKLKTGIKWLEKDDLLHRIPHLSPTSLLGGTYAPNDGSASPLKTINAFYSLAKQNKVEFQFNEPVIKVLYESNAVTGVETPQAVYNAPIVINAAGSNAAMIANLIGTNLSIRSNIHEAGVTEPVQRFLEPMIVDTRTIGNSSSIYFYQHATGQIIFCLTPEPPIWDKDPLETSSFLPLSATRLLTLIPGLKNLNVRRTWSGYYPMTPDGSPLIGWDKNIKGFLTAAGMCGQGFMLGPGIGKLIARMVLNRVTENDLIILKSLAPDRKFSGSETLK